MLLPNEASHSGPTILYNLKLYTSLLLYLILTILTPWPTEKDWLFGTKASPMMVQALDKEKVKKI